MVMDVPLPLPQAALAKSPNPSTETVTASSNGETRKQEAKWARVMLDAVYFAAERITGESHLQLALDRKPLALVADTIQDQLQIGPLGERIPQPAQNICFWIAVNCDVVDVGELGTCLSEAIADRL